MDFHLQPHSSLPAPLADVAWGGLLSLVLLALAGAALDLGMAFYALGVFLYGAIGGLIHHYWPKGKTFGAGNRITLLRGALVILLVSLAPFAAALEPQGLWFYSMLCVLALILDGVDGTVARKTLTESAFGARFDMELDALFILGLCIAVLALDKASAWVLLLGLMRYGFVLAGRFHYFLTQPLPESFRRKTVCVWQVVTLLIAVLPIVNTAFASWTLATALLLLSYSFGTDLHWLYQRRRHL